MIQEGIRGPRWLIDVNTVINARRKSVKRQGQMASSCKQRFIGAEGKRGRTRKNKGEQAASIKHVQTLLSVQPRRTVVKN